MANTFLTNQIVTYEALDVLETTYDVMVHINSEYSDQFRFGGAVLGQTLSIRKPPRFIGRLGQAVSIEAINETFVPLTLSYQRGVDTQVSSQDLILNIDDYRKRILEPQVVRVSTLIDQDVCNLAQGLNNFVGVPGTTPADLNVYLAAKTKLDNNLAPRDGGRWMFLNPSAEGAIVYALRGLFQASEEIKEQYMSGEMGRAIGSRWAMDQNIYVHTVGTLGGTPLTNGTTADGATSIVSDGWTATTTVLNAGDVVSFVSTSVPVNAVNQQFTQIPTPMQFVVTATSTADGSGNLTFPIAPAIYGPGTSLQNVTNLPANNTAIYVFDTAAASFSGITGKISPQNLAVHKDFGTLAMVDMPLPGGTDKAYRAASRKSGKSMRVIRDYVSLTDQWIQRLDVLYGVAVLRQELGVRVGG